MLAAHRRVQIVAGLLGHVGDLGLDHAQHLPAGDVHMGDDAVDRMRPDRVGGVVLAEGQRADHAAADLVLVAEGARGETDDDHAVEVGDPAAAHGLDPALVGLADRVGAEEVLVEARRRAVRGVQGLRGDGAAGGEVDDDVGQRQRVQLGEQQAHLAGQGVLRHPVEHLLLGRLAQGDVGEARGGVDAILGLQDLADAGDLLRAERGERMLVGGRGGVAHGFLL